jgi:hypothetical protein
LTQTHTVNSESMLPLAPVEDASSEIKNLLEYGRIARLEDWSLVNFQVGKRGPFLFGTIYGHEDVESDGKPGMCTSRLILFRPDLGYAITKNSIYVLGEKNR